MEELSGTLMEESVFGNELLLDAILNYAIFDDQGQANGETAKACKLVQRLWMRRVFVVLQKKRGCLVVFRPQKVPKFINAFVNAPAVRIPPYHLTVCPNTPSDNAVFSELDILKRCTDCLARCGEGLVHLTLSRFNEFWRDEWNTDDFSTVVIQLPHLEKIEITEIHQGTIAAPEGRERETTRFLRWILGGCETLHAFSVHLKNFSVQYLSSLAVDYHNLDLPLTLTEVSFVESGCHGIRLLDGLLLGNELPHLTSLKLTLPLHMLGYRDLLSRIMIRFYRQLQKFDLENTTEVTTFALPVMANLKELTCTRWSCDWPLEASPQAVQYFPKLKKLNLEDLRYDLVSQWIEYVTYVEVEEVSIPLEMPSRCADPTAADEVLLSQMRLVRDAFPRVTRLTVRLPYTPPMSPFKYILRNMKQLQELHLFVSCDKKLDSDHVNALLVGIRQRHIKALALECGDILERLTINLDGLSSLVNLNALRKLHLHFEGGGPIKLDVAFHLAFWKMPLLRKLQLSESFEVPPKVAQKWRKDGRELRLF